LVQLIPPVHLFKQKKWEKIGWNDGKKKIFLLVLFWGCLVVDVPG
jgi:hypothetical protein